MIRWFAALVLFSAVSGQAWAQEEDRYAQARLACMQDAVRLCPESLLDPDQARECMKSKRDLVSPGCAAFYPGGKRAKEVQ